VKKKPRKPAKPIQERVSVEERNEQRALMREYPEVADLLRAETAKLNNGARMRLMAARIQLWTLGEYNAKKPNTYLACKARVLCKKHDLDTPEWVSDCFDRMAEKVVGLPKSGKLDKAIPKAVGLNGKTIGSARLFTRNVDIVTAVALAKDEGRDETPDVTYARVGRMFDKSGAQIKTIWTKYKGLYPVPASVL
jgi:hypothetical protein